MSKRTATDDGFAEQSRAAMMLAPLCLRHLPKYISWKTSFILALCGVLPLCLAFERIAPTSYLHRR